MNETAKKRFENERKFPQWEQIGTGRKYTFIVRGRHGWWARYIKDVDENEVTLKFYQEIYDNNDQLVEVHNKYPVDEGHKKVRG